MNQYVIRTANGEQVSPEAIKPLFELEREYAAACRECDDAWKWAVWFRFDRETMTGFRKAYRAKVIAWHEVLKSRCGLRITYGTTESLA